MNNIKLLILSILLLAPALCQTTIAEEVKCVDGKASSFSCNDVDLIGRMTLSDFSLNPNLINDVWGYKDLNDGTEYAVVGLYNGVSVVNVTDPQNPVEVASLAGGGSLHRDIKVYQYYDEDAQRYKAYAYVSSDLYEGIEILDLNDLANSLTIVGRHSEGGRAHNVYISNVDHGTGMALDGFDAYLHLPISPEGGAFDISALTNPIAPEFIKVVSQTEGHDIVSFIVTDDRTSQCQSGHNPCEIIVNFSGSGKVIELWDVTDKQASFLISSISYTDSSYPHSGWMSDDGMFLFAQDEADELNHNLKTTMRTIDISDLANPVVSNVWSGPTSAIDHNGMTLGQYYYMSNYTRGLTVLDVSDSNQPEHVAYFDTYSTSDNTEFEGAWGVFPFLPSGKILVSDMTNGLFILSMNANPDIDDFSSTDDTPPVSMPPVPTSGTSSGGGSIFYLLGLSGLALIGRRRKF